MTQKNSKSRKCFWSKCSNHKRCDEFGSCVAIYQSAHKDELFAPIQSEAKAPAVSEADVGRINWLLTLASEGLEFYRQERLRCGHKFGSKKVGLYDNEVDDFQSAKAAIEALAAQGGGTELESQAKATEGKAGMAVGTPHVRQTTAGTGLRVGEAGAVQPATSEFMDVTAGETAPFPSDPPSQEASAPRRPTDAKS